MKNGSARTHEFLRYTGRGRAARTWMYGHVLVGGFETGKVGIPCGENRFLRCRDDRNEKGKSWTRRWRRDVARPVSPPIGIPPINLHPSWRA